MFFYTSILLFGCRHPIDQVTSVPAPPTIEGQDCEALLVDSETGTAAGSDLGSSTAFLTFGPDSSNLVHYRALATGAPATGSGSAGTVEITVLDTATNRTDPTNPLSGTLIPPTGSSEFGAAIQSADIMRCATDGTYHSCGQELIVGAPGSADGTGGVSIYRQRLTGNSAFEYVSDVPAPPGGFIPTGRFGASVAAPHSITPAPDEPYLTRGYSAWVAVGAPGADSVHIYSVDVISGTLLHTQTILAPTSIANKQFGETLAVGDFDDDGFWDLAVGSPEPNSTGDLNGRVVLYKGLGTTFMASPGDELILDGSSMWPTGAIQPDGFGQAIASGPLFADATNWTVVVGAPNLALSSGGGSGTSGEEGGVCWFDIRASSSAPLSIKSTTCSPNPWAAGPGTKYDNHFGSAVAVGNVVAEDDAGRVDSPEAMVHELVVGEPGYPTGLGDGRVVVFLTESANSGPNLQKYVAEIEDSSLLTWSELLILLARRTRARWEGARPKACASTSSVEQRSQRVQGRLRVGSTGVITSVGAAAFGSSLSTGYAAETIWTDLSIGSPTQGAGSSGAVSLTRSEPTAGTCSSQSLYGHWSWMTADGTTANVKIREEDDGISQSTRIVFGDPFFFALVKGSTGVRCVGEYDQDCDGDTACDETVEFDVEGYLPSGTVIELPGVLPCPNLTKSWTGIDMKPLATGLLQGTGVWDTMSEDDRTTYDSVVILADIDITLDASAGTMELSYVFQSGFWGVLTGLLKAGLLDPCVPESLIDPFTGSYQGEATCDPL